jgi:hypothetical protein
MSLYTESTILVCKKHEITQLRTNRSFADWRTKDSLTATIQLGHDDVLSLIGTCLSREIDEVGFIYPLVEMIQKEILQRHHKFTLERSSHRTNRLRYWK